MSNISSPAAIVSDLKNKVNALRSALLSAQYQETGHNLQLEGQKIQNIRTLRAQLSTLEDSLATAQYTAAMSAPAVVQQQRKHGMNAVELRTLFQGGRVAVRDLLTSTSGTVQKTPYSQWIAATRWTSPLVGLVNRIDRTGGPAYAKFAVIDDTGASQESTYVVEGGSNASIESDPTISVEINGADLLLTKLKYSVQLEKDAFQFQSFLLDLAAKRTSRAINYSLMFGKDEATGTALPNSAGGLLASAAVAGTVSTGAGQVGYGDLIETLLTAVDPSNRVNGFFMVSQTLYDLMLSQKDGMGRIFYDRFDDQGRLVIAGRPVVINSAMQFSSGKPAVLFGDFSKALAWLDAGTTLMTVSQGVGLAENLKKELLIHTRLGSAPILGSAVKQLIAQ